MRLLDPISSDMDIKTSPRHAYHLLMYTLRRDLPPAPSDPGAEIARDYAAIAQVAALYPANAAEAALAARVVAANAQAMDTMGLANDPTTDPKQVLQCVAQVASLMRQARAALRALQSLQAERRKREADMESASNVVHANYTPVRQEAKAPTAQPDLADVISKNDPNDQNMVHNPCKYVRETESGSNCRLASATETSEKSQEQKHNLIRQTRETNSADLSDVLPIAAAAGTSHIMMHNLISQIHETKSVCSPIQPVVINSADSSHIMKQILRSQSRETKSLTTSSPYSQYPARQPPRYLIAPSYHVPPNSFLTPPAIVMSNAHDNTSRDPPSPNVTELEIPRISVQLCGLPVTADW